MGVNWKDLLCSFPHHATGLVELVAALQEAIISSVVPSAPLLLGVLRSPSLSPSFFHLLSRLLNGSSGILDDCLVTM